MEASFSLVIAMASVTAIAGLVSLLIYRGLDESGETFMTKMKLHPDETYLEFQALMWAHGIQALGLLMLGTGVVIGYGDIGIIIGRTSTVIQGAITITVMARWFRRHRK